MLVKKILAGLFALVILLKLAIVLLSPQQWMGFAGTLPEHYGLVTAIYLILLVITGYYISHLDLIDIALVMFFTSILVGLALLPYATLLLSLNQQIIAIGIGNAWLTIVIWGALALAILYRVFSRER